MASDTVAVLRLFQIADSAFPVGGFAFSHGLEWLKQSGSVTDETSLAAFIGAYIDQVAGHQSLPAALAASRATTVAGLCRWDDRLDASFATASERNAGRAMGERLLVGALGSFGAATRATGMLEAVRSSETPGQYAIAFGAIAADQGVADDLMLTALASGMVQAATQTATRLGVVGQAGAARVLASAARGIDSAIRRTLDPATRAHFGTFAPSLDVAGILHANLSFRMFAS